MTKRPYISCPLEAALAIQNHGFCFVDIHGERYGTPSMVIHFYYNKPRPQRHLIAPESLPLLEPMDGDWVSANDMCYRKRTSKDGQFTIYEICGYSTRDGYRFPKNEHCESQFLNVMKIIHRNGKPFPTIQYEDAA